MEKIVPKVMFLFVIRAERLIIYQMPVHKDLLAFASIATKRVTLVRIARSRSTLFVIYVKKKDTRQMNCPKGTAQARARFGARSPSPIHGHYADPYRAYDDPYGARALASRDSVTAAYDPYAAYASMHDPYGIHDPYGAGTYGAGSYGTGSYAADPYGASRLY